MAKKETAEDIANKVRELNEAARLKERMGLFSNLHIIAGTISLVWIFYAVQYLVNSGWWSNRFAMSPPEFVGFISGMVLPLVLIWLMVAYIDRARQFQKDSETLQKYMEQLVSPTEEGAAYTKALTDTLRVYVKEFKDVFNEVSSSSGIIASDLKDRVHELQKVQGDLQNNTRHVVDELSSRADGIVDAAKSITENAKDTAEGLKWQIENLNLASEQSNNVAHNLGASVQDYIEKFKQVSENLANQTGSLTEDLNSRTEMLYKASDITKDALVNFSSVLSDQIGLIEETTDRVKSRTDNIGVIVDEKAQRLEQVFAKQEQGLDNMTAKIDEKAMLIDNSLKNQSEFLDSEIEKVMTRFHLIEEGLSIQTGEMVNASDKIIDDLNKVYGTFAEYKQNLLTATDDAVGKIMEVGNAYDKQAYNLNDKSVEIGANLNNVTKTLEDNFHSYSALTDGLGERLSSLNITTGKQIEELRNVIDDVGGVIANVKDDIKNQSADLVDLTGVINSQGQMIEASLNQQQKTVSTTATRIDEIKNDLKNQVETLETFCDKLDNQANNYLKKTNETMVKAQNEINLLAKQTNEVNASLSVELTNIDATNTNTLSVSEKVTAELGKHAKIIKGIMEMMQNRTNDIYKLFTSQKSVIESSSKEIQTKVGKISADFEKNITLLTKNSHDILVEVSDVSKELQVRTEEIDSLFVKQDALLNTSAEQLTESANKVSEIMRTSSSQLDNDIDRIRARISLIEDSLSVQVKDLIKASEESLMKISSLSDELAKQSDNVTSISRESQDSLNEVVMNVLKHSSSLVSMVETIENQAVTSSSTVADKTNNLEGIINIIGDKAQGVVASINEHMDVLDKGALKAQAQAQVIRNVLGQQVEELTDISNIVSTNTRLSEAAITAQCKTLHNTTDAAADKIKEVGNLLKQGTSDVLSSVTRVGKELEYVGGMVKDKSIEAHKIVEETMKNTQETAKSLEDQYKLLEDMSQKAIVSISAVVSQLKNNGLSVEGASTTSIEKIQAVGDALATQKIQMDHIAEEATKSIRIFAQTIKDKGVDFNDAADGIEKRIVGFIESIRNLAKEFEDIANDSVAKVDVTSSHLRSTITEVSTNSGRIAGNVKDATVDFVKQSESLNKSAGEAIMKLEDLLSVMRENSSEIEDVNDKLSANALKVGGALSRHIQALISASNTAEEQVQKLDKKSLEVSHDNFLKEASFIIEKLQAVAVDITRIFDPNIEEDLWKKYYNGDRASFMRYLIKALDKHQVSSIRKLFENDKDFRDYVAGYMANFEAVLDRAKVSDRSDVIIAILTGSDVGRLYMILARALGNKE